MTTLQQPAENLAWYSLSPEAAAGQMGVDPDQALDAGEVRRLAQYGANELPTEPPPSIWAVAALQVFHARVGHSGRVARCKRYLGRAGLGD